MSDDLERRRRRAAWRADHRGTKELDLLIGGYARAKLATMTSDDLARFEGFLALPDPELQGRILAPEGAGEGDFAEVIRAVRQFHGLA